MIQQPDLKILVMEMNQSTGLSFDAKWDYTGQYVDFLPQDLDQAEGFRIRVTLGWRSIESKFIPGNFSGLLLNSMGNSSHEQKQMFKTIALSARNFGFIFEMEINNIGVDACSVETWPEDWNIISLAVKRTPFELSPGEQAQNSISEIATLMGRMVLCLLPVEEENGPELPGIPEGFLFREETNRYERSPLNRSLCIAFKGTKCKVCGFDFEAFYGSVGKGFIHVHHTVPVSKMGPGYIVNPLHDLVPVCPNCHSMLHKKDPPFTVEELKAIVESDEKLQPGIFYKQRRKK